MVTKPDDEVLSRISRNFDMMSVSMGKPAKMSIKSTPNRKDRASADR